MPVAEADGQSGQYSAGWTECPRAEGHPGIHPYAADITEDGVPQDLVRHTVEEFGRLDVLVNNAGIVGGGQRGPLTKERIEPLIATNLTAPVLLMQAALEELAERASQRFGTPVRITTGGHAGAAVVGARPL